MIFNSFEFALFLPVIFLAYWFVVSKHLRAQNFFLICAGYFFYGWWDWRFLTLLAFSTVVDYSVGVLMKNTADERRRKLWLVLGIAVNLVLLGFFKYFNFFVDSFVAAFGSVGVHLESRTLNVILPVGISFYTFQSMSYAIDVYQRKTEPVTDFVTYAAFVSFFPQLCAGPIERAGHMMPQFSKPRQFDFALALDGMRQILWGLFKKVVIADNCALLVNDIFANYQTLSGAELALGCVFFAFQIYGDFSGYSDIALGTAKLFGFRLMVNFDYPYFSKNITEFWRRWHISLSNWFRDYLFTPLAIAFRHWNSTGIAALLLTFFLIGLWHGANWNFVLFGVLHGLLLTYEILTKKVRKKWRKGTNPQVYDFASMGLTFAVWCLTLVFFRAHGAGEAFSYLGHMFTASFAPQNFWLFNKYVFLGILLLVAVDWLSVGKEHPLQGVTWIPSPVRWGVYLAMSFFIFNFIHYKQEFIYFQF